MAPEKFVADMTLNEYRAWLGLTGETLTSLGPMETAQLDNDVLINAFIAAAPKAGLSDLFQLGLSPLKIFCNQSWCPFLRRYSELFGYTFTWKFNPTSIPHPIAGIEYRPYEVIATMVKNS